MRDDTTTEGKLPAPYSPAWARTQALAPEMAEALLAYAHWLELDATFDHEAVIRPVLDKLRAIGATDA